eukprot:6081199-Amphidinium_carterae.2
MSYASVDKAAHKMKTAMKLTQLTQGSDALLLFNNAQCKDRTESGAEDQCCPSRTHLCYTVG